MLFCGLLGTKNYRNLHARCKRSLEALYLLWYLAFGWLFSFTLKGCLFKLLKDLEDFVEMSHIHKLSKVL